MMRVLGISGKRGAGKDTMYGLIARHAHYFAPYKPVRIGLADPLKELVMSAFGVSRDAAYGDDAAKDALIPGTQYSVRDALKIVGAGYRAVREDHWVNVFEKACRAHERVMHAPLIVCTDVRFPNEVARIQAMGGKVVRLLRAPREDSHVSETALDDWTAWDGIIDNRECSAWEAFAQLLQRRKEGGWA